jgi:hypothetical protein
MKSNDTDGDSVEQSMIAVFRLFHGTLGWLVARNSNGKCTYQNFLM